MPKTLLIIFRARRIAESALGSLACKWRVLSSTIQSGVDEAVLITYACVCMHNWLIEKKDIVYTTHDGDESSSTDRTFDSVQQVGVSSFAHYAFDVRERFKHFFNNEGSVDWQWTRIANGRY
jgi:hypothetical protein